MAKFGGGLTREQFLFFEAREIARLKLQDLSDEEIINTVFENNILQFPTDKMIENITKVCLKRIEFLDDKLLNILADGNYEAAKLVNLYSIIKENELVEDFMVNAIGEKFKRYDYKFSDVDLNVYFMDLVQENATVASWSDATIKKIKQVLKKILLECGYIDSTKSTTLNSIVVDFELETILRGIEKIEILNALNIL